MFIEPSIVSSFKESSIGKDLYSYVIENKPALILELGVLNGYSTACFLQAIRDLETPTYILSVDLFSLYKYRNCSLSTYSHNVSIYYSPNSFHSIIQADVFSLNFQELLSIFGDIPRSQVLTFIDISNDAQSLARLFNDLNTPVLFEGGTSQRDSVQWMIDYNKIPISSLPQMGFDYHIINPEFPALSYIDLSS